MDEGTAVPVTYNTRPQRLVVERVSVFSLISDLRNWPVWLVVIACGVVFYYQQRGVLPLNTWAFSASAIAEGRWWTPLTSMFMHADAPVVGYVHILSNMWAYLQLAPLVAARFGRGWRGVVPFHIFYILCGLAGTLAFWAMHPDRDIPVVGASGAVYGVYAAMMRLDLFRDRLAPVLSSRTWDAVWFFIWSNALVVGLFVLSSGGLEALQALARGQLGGLYIPIAWEAHLGGFIAGFFLIGLMKGKGWDGGWKAGIRVSAAD